MYIFGITGISKQKEVLIRNSVRIVQPAVVKPEGSFYMLIAFFYHFPFSVLLFTIRFM